LREGFVASRSLGTSLFWLTVFSGQQCLPVRGLELVVHLRAAGKGGGGTTETTLTALSESGVAAAAGEDDDGWSDDEEDDGGRPLAAPAPPPSAHQKRLEHVKARVAALEAEMLGEKDWFMRGEAQSGEL
jgi:Mpp10 protein